MIEEIALAGTHCFEDVAVLGDLTTINYVFGPNGSGKTTISQGLASLSVTDGDAGGLAVQWGQTKSTVKVYNRDYVRKAFTSVDGEEPGVFLLGDDVGEAYEQIKAIEKQKTKADQKVIAAQTNLNQRLAEAEKLRSDLADTVWLKRSVIPAMLQKRMSGLRGSKDQCLEKVLAAAKVHPLRGNDDFDALSKKAEVAFDDSATEVPLFPEAPKLSWDEASYQRALTTPIVGSADVPLMELIDRLGNSDWVHEGLEHLKSGENLEGLCPFCQQKSPAGLAEQLAIVFDETYEKKQAEVAGFLGIITEAVAALQQYKNDNATSIGNAAGEEADRAFHLLTFGLAAAEKAVNQKLLKPSDKVSFASVKADYDSLSAIVDTANDAIRKTNTVIAGRRVQRNLIVDEAWREFARGYLNELLNSHVKQSEQSDRVTQSFRDTIRTQGDYSEEHETQLKPLRKKTTSSATTIDVINRLLEISQFHSIKLAAAKAKKDGYRIIREDGQPADIGTLSEGERTFITFLYYYQSLSEVKQEHESDKVVAVIDDPISSLDGDIMFVVSALIRMLIEETRIGNHDRVQQVIILTHNTRFHNEVSYHHSASSPSATKYYRIRKYAPQPNAVEDCGQKNPIRTAYQELWDEVQTAATHRTKQMPWLPNVMRRILESYFTTLGGEKNLYEVGAELLPVERALHNALIAWSHSGSHTIMDDDAYAQNSAPSGLWLDAFKRLFEKTSNGAHFGHYAMMMDRAKVYVV